MFSVWGRVPLILLLASFCLVTVAQEKKSTGSAKAPAASAKKDVSSTKSAKQQTTRPRGRLPRYFSSLVDDKQRAEIYQIQALYREKIQELETELAKLELEQMSEIEDSLSATQRKELSELREKSRAGSGSTSGTKPKSRAKSKSTSAKSATEKSVASTKSSKK
jgi:hypothetical protein